MTNKNKKKKIKRNDSLVDAWSFVHLFTAGAMAFLFGPFAALMITTLWEPFEIFILSPLMARLNIVFGFESLKNSLSDLAFNTTGIGIAILLGAM